jgi:hypothetical protein
MKKMNDIEKMYAPFSITKVREKVAYCNNNIIPLLKEKKIDWDMDVKEQRIIFCGRRFPLGDIDNGEAEKFINSLNDEEPSLDLWR